MIFSQRTTFTSRSISRASKFLLGRLSSFAALNNCRPRIIFPLFIFAFRYTYFINWLIGWNLEESFKICCISGIINADEDKNLPYLFLTPKLHKVRVKDRFIAGSNKCAAKGLSCLLTEVLITTIRDGLIMYCNTSHKGVSGLWIAEKVTNLPSPLDQHDVREAKLVK